MSYGWTFSGAHHSDLIWKRLDLRAPVPKRINVITYLVKKMLTLFKEFYTLCLITPYKSCQYSEPPARSSIPPNVRITHVGAVSRHYLYTFTSI